MSFLYTFTMGGASSVYELYVLFLRTAITLAVALSLLVSADRLSHILECIHLQLRILATGRRPEDAYKPRKLPNISLDTPGVGLPKVAVQLPMFNERAVCQAIIDSACEMVWPWARLKIQVLDDSTDSITRNLVDDKVVEWRERGLEIECIRRVDRSGYKAGALKEGMERLMDCDHVAVFDADFKPDPGFLRNLVPYLIDNPQVGYVQACWAFTNPEESYLTKAQETSLNYHCKCEQWVHFASGSFFNFNGTAGIWRRKTIEAVGGWNSRTTVEDMDLSLRTYLAGWKAIYLKDVTCLNELPASFFAYRKQQHRWTCGPVQLWRKAAQDIYMSKLPLLRKLELIVLYFGLRKCVTHWVSIGFFCTLVPLSMFTPEVTIPMWALIHVPVLVTISTAAFTPRGWWHCILYVLFENAMGLVKLWAVVAGLLDLKHAQEWVVTTKLGSSDKRPGTQAPIPRGVCRFYGGEALMSLFVLSAALYGVAIVQCMSFAVFLTLQGLVFLAFAFNMVDCGGLLGGRIGDNTPAQKLMSKADHLPVVRSMPLPDMCKAAVITPQHANGMCKPLHASAVKGHLRTFTL